MAKKVKQSKQIKTQVPLEGIEKTKDFVSLVEYLLNLDKNLLDPLNATSMSDNNCGRIYY